MKTQKCETHFKYVNQCQFILCASSYDPMRARTERSESIKCTLKRKIENQFIHFESMWLSLNRHRLIDGNTSSYRTGKWKISFTFSYFVTDLMVFFSLSFAFCGIESNGWSKMSLHILFVSLNFNDSENVWCVNYMKRMTFILFGAFFSLPFPHELRSRFIFSYSLSFFGFDTVNRVYCRIVRIHRTIRCRPRVKSNWIFSGMVASISIKFFACAFSNYFHI